MRRRPGKALDSSQVRAIVDFARDLAPLAGLGASVPRLVLGMAAMAAWLSLGCTREEAVELGQALIDSGEIGYRTDASGDYRLLVPCGHGTAALRYDDLVELVRRAEGGAR